MLNRWFTWGDCSIQEYNARGEDVFWTVTEDKVLSLMIFDFDSDGENEVNKQTNKQTYE